MKSNEDRDMSFLRHKEIYRSDEGDEVRDGSLADEVVRGRSMVLRHKEIYLIR